MRSTKLRIMSALVLVVGAFAMIGSIAPSATAQGTIIVTIINQPKDAKAGELITAAPFDPTGGVPGYVEVQVTETVPECPEPPCADVPVVGADVTFELPAGAPSQDLVAGHRPTGPDGIATFEPLEDNPLHIDTPNEPFTSDYELIPVVNETAYIDSTSNGFDIWEDGCHGAHCQTTLTPPDKTTVDTYETTEDVGMGTSVVVTGGTILDCPGQKVIFDTLDPETETLFFHATSGFDPTEGPAPVFLFSHITRHDMKEATNNGQKHVGWCVGVKTAGPWNFVQQDTNGNDVTGDAGDLFVGMAPKCPRKNAMNFAPCIVSQMGDNLGGSFIRGWLPGGDPPRRT
jgi:hypothetical protein